MVPGFFVGHFVGHFVVILCPTMLFFDICYQSITRKNLAVTGLSRFC